MVGMARVDWSRNRELAATELRAGEALQALFPAITASDDGGSAMMPAALLPVVAAVERWQDRRTARSTSKTSLFPLAPRMVMGLTNRRILVWRAGRRWSMGTFLGFVPMDAIVRAEVLTVGEGWRTVRVDLANEPSVRFRVPGQLADDFADALSGRFDG